MRSRNVWMFAVLLILTACEGSKNNGEQTGDGQDVSTTKDGNGLMDQIETATEDGNGLVDRIETDPVGLDFQQTETSDISDIYTDSEADTWDWDWTEVDNWDWLDTDDWDDWTDGYDPPYDAETSADVLDLEDLAEDLDAVEQQDGPQPATAFDMVYNEAAGFVMGNSHKIVSAEEVKAALDVDPSHYYIIDVRGAGQFNAGHVPGSINVTLGALWSHIEAGQVPLDKPVLVVCSAGQQSGWANGLLNLMGYDSWSLDWGMPAWNLVAGNMWAGGTSDQATGEKTADIPETVGPFPDPVLSGTGGPEELAVQQAQAVFQGGFKLKTWSSVKNSLADYHIIYYGSIAEYEAGHLPGAHHFEPFVDLAPQGKLATLAGDNNILVTSCSGQKAASIAAVLNALGYQAWFLKFGHNSLWHSELTDCAWHNSFSMSYPVAP